MANTSGNRVSIYVPADLKRRMDKTKEDVNWSALACDAFKAKLGELAQRKEAKNMNDIIDRLRASQESTSTEARKDGSECGRTWVRLKAQVPELRRLSALAEREANGGDRWSDCEQLAYAILGPNADRHDVRAFWEDVSGAPDDERITDADWLQGFVDGSLELWAELEPQL